MIKKSIFFLLFFCLATFQVQSRVLIREALRDARALQQLRRQQPAVGRIQDPETRAVVNEASQRIARQGNSLGALQQDLSRSFAGRTINFFSYCIYSYLSFRR